MVRIDADRLEQLTDAELSQLEQLLAPRLDAPMLIVGEREDRRARVAAYVAEHACIPETTVVIRRFT